MRLVKVKNISGNRLSVMVQGVSRALTFEKNEHKLLKDFEAEAMKEMLGEQRKSLFRFVNVMSEAEKKLEEPKMEDLSVAVAEVEDKPKKKGKSKK